MAASSFLAILLLIIPLFADNSLAKTLKRDAKALNQIKQSLGWRVVYSWVGDDPCGDGALPPWSGVKCSPQGDYRVVTELNLRWNKLQDVLPPEIGELKSLTHLYLSFNSFKGEIPKELANLQELRYLHLHVNRFSGHIPPELGTLEKLQHLDVGNNHLVGTLRELLLLDGCFPALRNLYLNNNYLTGGIPSEIANLTNLEILHLSSNKMSGVLPIGLAHIPRLTYLYLDQNQFSGRIPDAFYRHRFLKELYIEGNSFKRDAKPIGAHKVLELTDTEFLV